MKYKVLKHKITGLYIKIDQDELWSGNVPHLMSENVTLENIQNVFPNINFNNVKLVKVELNEII